MPSATTHGYVSVGQQKLRPHVQPASNPSEKSDLLRWRLVDERGRQTWVFLDQDIELKEWPQSVADKHFLGLPLVSAACTIIPSSLTLIALGLSKLPSCLKASRRRHQCDQLLLPASASTRQLGL